ncbi:peptidylprolyl isomerase [Aliidiomarina sedimenti]|uniref:Periplasmic chaperone PpiD n=1 Tax=Aliidiomarina sedimenti TaxID=1933879 RepID=A0ABY0C368_9GAMM|nr:SurA N-terminal domain-containing protein [Aliidiomarina sedimenti]RUO32199.1 peptidylprolyl isomerase [Aliidiomarina sedimenti]
MLDRIREGSKGPVAKIILFLIILTFALTGVSGYLGGNADDHVAEVNGEKISRTDFDRAYQNERAQMEDELGDFVETLFADEDYMGEFRQGVLERLIEERLATQFASEQGFRPGPQQIRDAIRNMPDFQINGQFNNDRYVALLTNAGFTPEQFRDYMVRELGRTTFLQGALMSEFMLPSEAEAYQRLQNQRRSGEYIRVPAQSYTDVVSVSEDEIEAFYAENEARFETDERVRVDYIVLEFNDILESVSIDDAQARDFYEQNPGNFRTPERREIAHILVEGNDADARSRIEDIASRLEAGEDFAELAAEYSDDTFSGQDGGLLGRLERGMIDPDIEDAGFALDNEGDVSDIVESEFGFHLVKLTSLRETQLDPYEEVAETIKENLRQQEAEQQYFTLQQTLSRVSFEAPESLQPAAEETGLDIQRSEWMDREGVNEFADQRLLNAVFDSDVLRDNLNSELVEVDERSYVVRVNEYEPASLTPLDDVRSDIEQALVMRKARDEARRAANELLAQYRAGELPEGVEAESFSDVSRNDSELPAGVVSQLFRLPAPSDDAVSADIAELRGGDVAIVALTDVTEGEVSDDGASELRQRFENRYADAAYRAIMEALKEDASITRNL